MNKRKENLITNLELVIHGLKTDTVKYEWNKSNRCNCGLVAQAMLKLDASQLSQRIDSEALMNKTEIANRLGVSDPKNVELTWRNAAQAYCPLTGEPLKQIFKDLEAAGLSKEDIVHLEYMNNEAILKRSGIQVKTAYTKSVQTGTKKTPKWRAFGRMIDAVKEEPI